MALRYKHRDEELIFRARPNLRLRGVDWPLFAIFGGLGTALSWLVVVEQEAPTRWAGLGWLAAGFVMYAVYRRRVVHAPLMETVRAPVVIGPAVALEYRNVLVPVVLAARVGGGGRPRLPPRRRAGRRRSSALTVLEVPLELPLDAELPGHAERKAHDLLDEARAIGDAYGVDVVGRLVREPARRAGDRRRGRAAQQRDRRDGRTAARRAPPPRADLRRHGRLRAQERAVPRDGGGCAARRMRRRLPRRPGDRIFGRSSRSDSAIALIGADARGMRHGYRGMTAVFGVVAIGIGIAIVVQTARYGGGFGYPIGALFVALGAGRLYLLRRR